MRAPVIVIAILCVGPWAYAGSRDWVGSAKCGSCHPAELAAWQATPHATTRSRFVDKPPAKCLACHGTGEAPAGPSAVEVGCEACHGAGAAYAADDLMRNRFASITLGLVDLSTPKARAAACAFCHSRRVLSTGKFDPTAPVHPVKR